MAITKERKAELVKRFGKNEKDSGNTKVQIAILTDEINDLTKVVARYKEADVWCENPYFNEEGFNRLMDVMEEANELDKRAPFDIIVDNSFVEKVLKKH